MAQLYPAPLRELYKEVTCTRKGRMSSKCATFEAQLLTEHPRKKTTARLWQTTATACPNSIGSKQEKERELKKSLSF